MGQESEHMPDKFWMILYHETLWDRDKLAFVSQSMLKKADKKQIDAFWFFDHEEVLQQARELGSKGIKVEVREYKKD